MADDPLTKRLKQLVALSTDELCTLYLDLVDSAPGQAQVAALGLREKARAGGIDSEQVSLLEACLLCAPDLSCVVHLAKALAAFGREAQGTVPALVDRMRPIQVMDDTTYWIFDGCIWSLGYLGGDDAVAMLDELLAEKPARVTAQVGYQGRLSKAHREKHWVRTLNEVRARAAAPDAGVWREKKTKLQPLSEDGPPETVNW
ncbi:MAG: hypothetical protein JNK82_34410 [Myxococcaceae bacterium]|nr:hypothetical protein [Myxococcaceae bacterium]